MKIQNTFSIRLQYQSLLRQILPLHSLSQFVLQMIQMDNPKLLLSIQEIEELPIPPVSKEIIITLKRFIKDMPLLEIKNYIKKDDDFMRILKNQQEMLIRYLFKKLFAKIININLSSQHKLSLLKVGTAAALEAKIDVTIGQYCIAISQISSLIISSNNFDYSIVIKYIIQKIRELYSYSINLLKVPKLIEVLIKSPPEYQVCLVEALLELIKVPDQYARQVNRIIIKTKILWLKKIAYNVLHCSHLILQSLKNDTECLDPYNMYTIWFQEYDACDDPVADFHKVFKNGIYQIKFLEILDLYIQLGYHIGMRQLELLDILNFPLNDQKSSNLISKALLLSVASSKFLEQFRPVHDDKGRQLDKQQKQEELSADKQIFLSKQQFQALIKRIINQEIFVDGNYYWLVTFKHLLEYNFTNYQGYNYQLFCEYLIDKRVVEAVFIAYEEKKSQTFFMDMIFKILNYICISRTPKFDIELSEVTDVNFFQNLIGSTNLYFAFQFISSFLNSSNFNYPSRPQKKQAMMCQKYLISNDLLNNPSQLFIATTLMAKNNASSSLLISILLHCDSTVIFQDWLKFQYREQLLKSGQTVFEIKQIDDSLSIELKSWIKHYDSKDRRKLKAMFGIEYHQLRKRVEAIIEIFS